MPELQDWPPVAIGARGSALTLASRRAQHANRDSNSDERVLATPKSRVLGPRAPIGRELGFPLARPQLAHYEAGRAHKESIDYHELSLSIKRWMDLVLLAPPLLLVIKLPAFDVSIRLMTSSLAAACLALN